MSYTESEPITLYGKGFIGSYIYEMLGENRIVIQERDNLVPQTNNILWGISTTHNYHIYTNPYLDVDTNLTLMLKVLERSKREFGSDFTFNLLSSWFVYGKAIVPAQEHYACKPTGFYSSTALCREQLLASYCETYGINYRILRLANVIGVGDQKVSAKKNALQYMIRELVHGNPVQLYKGEITRDYIDVRDVVRVIWMIISSSDTLNQIYNVGNGYGYSISELIYKAAKTLGAEKLISTMDVPDFHKIVQVPTMYLAIGKIKALGYISQYNMAETLEWIIQDYKNE